MSKVNEPTGWAKQFFKFDACHHSSIKPDCPSCLLGHASRVESAFGRAVEQIPTTPRGRLLTLLEKLSTLILVRAGQEDKYEQIMAEIIEISLAAMEPMVEKPTKTDQLTPLVDPVLISDLDNVRKGSCVDCGGSLWSKQPIITDETGSYHPLCRVTKERDKAIAKLAEIRPIFELALEIQEILEAVDRRCMVADGPVTPAKKEITADELRRIYVASLKIKAISSRLCFRSQVESRKRNG